MARWIESAPSGWFARIEPILSLAGATIFFGSLMGLGRSHTQFDSYLVASSLFGFALAVLATWAPLLVRCQVCGLPLLTSTEALALSSAERVRWIKTIERCPVCGDDGRASNESRARWQASGLVSEKAYWSKRRIALAVFGALLFIVGGIAVGGSIR